MFRLVLIGEVGHTTCKADPRRACLIPNQDLAYCKIEILVAKTLVFEILVAKLLCSIPEMIAISKNAFCN
jgi:hypothetical protein